MGIYRGPHITTDGLVFGYDTGYGISDNSTTTRHNLGEPTVNLLPNPELEKTGANEYLPYAYVQDIIDTYGTGSYSISFELKLAIAGEFRCYTQDTSARKYTWTNRTFQGTTEYKRYSYILDDISLYDDNYTNNRISFYATYETGKIPTVKNVQITQNNHAAPFVSGSRSTTESLLDLTGNTTIDLSNVSFDSNSQMYFDGISNNIQEPLIQYGHNDAWSAEFVLDPGNSDAETHWNGIFGKNLANGGYWMFHSSKLTWYEISDSLWYSGISLGTSFPFNTYTHCVITYDGNTNYKIYINGIESDSNSMTFLSSYSGAFQYIGSSSTRFGRNNIPIFKHYNKTLSQKEVSQNFNSLKGRFGI